MIAYDLDALDTLPTQDPSLEGDIQDMQSLMTGLAVRLRDGDTGSAAYLRATKKHISREDMEERIACLERHISSYDFDEARDVLSQIAAHLHIRIEEADGQRGLSRLLKKS